jgi:hypothetical protein
MAIIRISKKQTPNISIYIEKTNDQALINEIAGMLRGLANAIGGFKTNSGKNNQLFREKSPVKMEFNNVENANYFKECVEYYFSEEILENSLKAKRRYRTK